MRYVWLLLLMTACYGLGAAEMILDGGSAASAWRFVPGGEFPGARGGLVDDPESGRIRLDYDFSGGGKYVALYPLRTVPVGTERFAVTLRPGQNMTVNYRITDRSGRVFQGKSIALKAGAEQKIVCTLNGPWSTAWGGDPALKAPVAPMGWWLMVEQSGSRSGSLTIGELLVSGDKLGKSEFSGEDFHLSSCGWEFDGQWQAQPEGALLKITAINRKGRAAEMSFDFPEAARNQVKRYKLNSKMSRQVVYYNPPMTDKGNRRNRYQIVMRIEAASGENTVMPLMLSGSASSGINLGDAMDSKAIASSKFGTCVHFSYGTSGAFKGWKPYEELLDDIAACGFKWIRDGGRVEKDKQGNYRVREYDLDWIRAAQRRGIGTIMVIGMYSRDDLPEFLKQVEATIRDTSGLVKVFELGNEPNNFGDWIKKYGGTWNGKGKDNSTSPWVKAHLKYTNAAADLIKKLSPDAVVLGTGACAPTNFRYLELGLSKNVDGVVEHPYSFSLPPEKIPFGLGLVKRDGIAVGDKDHTFAGLIRSYLEKSRATGKERQVWVTEFGFSTFWFNGKTEKGLYAGFTEEAQASYLVRRMLESLTLPIAVTCQYDFLDDYGSDQFKDEANFGLLRADRSRKPSYFVIQRFNSLCHAAVADVKANVKVTAEPLHRSCRRGELVKNWDDVSIDAANGIKAIALKDPRTPKERMLAVWSVLPYSREFNNRVCSLKIDGWREFNAKPVAIDLITGRSYDLSVKFEGDTILLENLILKGNPILIKFFRD